ncbi:MAG: hypothetical protein JXB00_00995 [Bacteroidales bacterium]|nr:hypothetical protein [Bacteroidales bacterium]
MKDQTLIRLVVVILSVLIKCYCSAQTLITIYTPKGNPVPDTYSWIPEWTSYQVDSANLYTSLTYPNATRIADVSRTYNCHGYAWQFSEGGQPLWIGWRTVGAQSIYWSDGSYIESSNQVYPAKVRYAGVDHSAITTDQQDIFISKWRFGPLMRHHKDYSPYYSSTLLFYI